MNLDYARQNPPTFYKTSPLLSASGRIRMHAGYLIAARTATGDETHLAGMGSSRTHCGCKVTSAINSPAGITCEKCATTRTPMTLEEIHEELELTRGTYGPAWKPKNPMAGRFEPLPLCPGSDTAAPDKSEWIKTKGPGSRRAYGHAACPECGKTISLYGKGQGADYKPATYWLEKHEIAEPE